MERFGNTTPPRQISQVSCPWTHHLRAMPVHLTKPWMTQSPLTTSQHSSQDPPQLIIVPNSPPALFNYSFLLQIRWETSLSQQSNSVEYTIRQCYNSKLYHFIQRKSKDSLASHLTQVTSVKVPLTLAFAMPTAL